MENQHDLLLVRRRELLEVANGMLCNEVHLLEGIRRICDLRFAIDDPDNQVFYAIRALESETDIFPLGAVRVNYSDDFLKQADARLASYLEDASEDIVTACNEIIRAFSLEDEK